MSEKNIKLLGSLITAYLSTLYYKIPPTEEEFNICAKKIKDSNATIASVSDSEFDRLKKILRENIVVIQDTGVCLPDLENGHQSWLPAKKADIDFYFWDRYKKYLEVIKHWNPRVTSKIGQVSDEILDQCGDPSTKAFHIRGLILGDVQSGKTSNYTALANKAADVGYDIIIVLAGIPELLRQQTQKRLDEELCGKKSNSYLDPLARAKYVPVGVGRFGHKKNFAMFTSEASDFNVQVLKSNNLALDNVKCPILLVVKKNKTILHNLFRWLKGNNLLNSKGQIDRSILLIDDEADNASINTKDADSEPTAINNAIRQLYQLFARATYLAVTATPFANIFIDSNLPDDLFPADFIYALEAPTNYIGAERIFSDDGDHRCMLQRIDLDEFYESFPQKHKKELIVKDLPADLYEAVYYFLLANAIRDYRGENKTHRSMMVHVSRFVHVQGEVVEIINAWLDQVKSDLTNYSKLPPMKAELIENIHRLHSVWDKHHLDRVSGITWKDVLKNYLYRATAPIDVRAVNGASGSASLDYDSHKEDGLRVIAVGGNTLSRGLTLEGLMVTYFCRDTNMYDTLMQMGRWFGYRPNYDDLVKIWLAQDAIDWYGQINEATQDLRDQIYRMKLAKQSPRQFGLKVKQDPGSLIVTARNKMRTAQPLKCPINVSGHMLETPRLIASNEVLKQNAEAVELFIDRLSTEGSRVSKGNKRTHGSYFWEHVSSEEVAGLLDNFQTHPWHLSYNGKALADYISKHTWKNGWDVALIDKGEGKAYPKTLKCGEETIHIEHTEKRNIEYRDNILSVSGHKLRVGAGGCARIGLNEEQIRAVKAEFEKTRKNGKKKSIPDSEYLIKDRNPILMIHIIDADYVKRYEQEFPEFLFGLGVGIPLDESGNATVVYQVNLVELRNWIAPDADDLDE